MLVYKIALKHNKLRIYVDTCIQDVYNKKKNEEVIMSKPAENCKIHVAFRFHANLYHSYRADTIDEDGLGKDIRIIKYCLDILDMHNKNGIPVKGTWDIENYYSLELNMKKLCPELTERIKKRVADGYDEVELMSYDNGIISAHTEQEAMAAIEKAISNEGGSGLKDIFTKFAPIIRPQECMMTPSLIRIYNKIGIEAFSIYYSCIPFNGFSNFVPKLTTKEKYNPLWYTAPGYDDKIKILPAINPGDVYDNMGLTKLVKNLRKEQLAMDEPCDLLVLLDMDADDDFWQGYVNTTLSFAMGLKEPLLKGGLNIFIKKLAKLSYVEFTTPYEYLKTHEPVGTVCYGQDTADGAFDGYSPWSDKLENTKLWTGIDRTRLINSYALSVSGNDANIKESIDKSLESRLKTTSTTHFGLSTPVMCKPRLDQAMDMVKNTMRNANRVLNKAKELVSLEEGKIRAFIPNDYLKGDKKVKGLIRLKANDNITLEGKGIKGAFTREIFKQKELNLVYEGSASDISLKISDKKYSSSVYCKDNCIGNKYISLKLYNDSLTLYKGEEIISDKGSFATSVNYDNKIISATDIKYSYEDINNNAAIVIETGKLIIDKDNVAEYTKKYMIAGDLPYLYVDMDITYPKTSDYGTNKGKVRRLKRGYDTRWREIMPLEIIPAFRGTTDNPIRLFKHNFIGEMSYFDYDYYKFSKNENISASNNAITCGLVSFVNNHKGLLVAQSVAADNNFAFNRVRISKEDNQYKATLNPFGVYSGNQLEYITEKSGLPKKMALYFAESFMSCAPTFRGGTQTFSLMIAPFEGEQPDDNLINDAIMHAYPPYILSKDSRVDMIEFAEWDNYEPTS